MRWLLLLLWAVLAIGVVASVAAHAWLGDESCELGAGSGNDGEMSWSVMPPGKKCTWTEEANGVDVADGPHLAWSLAALYLLAAPVVVLVWFRGDTWEDDGP